MSFEAEGLEINPCALCGGRHRYTLNLEIAIVSAFIEPGEKPSEKKFVRLFVCPKTGNTFQAEISLPVEPGTKIKTVEVVGGE